VVSLKTYKINFFQISFKKKIGLHQPPIRDPPSISFCAGHLRSKPP